MIELADRTLLRWAIAGDVAVLIALTAVGFMTHSTLDETSRLIVTTIGVLAAWALVSPWFGVFSTATLTQPAAVWRVALAWTVAAPFAAFLRALILDLGISATFVVVMIVVNAPVLALWRGLYAAAQREEVSSARP